MARRMDIGEIDQEPERVLVFLQGDTPEKFYKVGKDGITRIQECDKRSGDITLPVYRVYYENGNMVELDPSYFPKRKYEPVK